MWQASESFCTMWQRRLREEPRRKERSLYLLLQSGSASASSSSSSFSPGSSSLLPITTAVSTPPGRRRRCPRWPVTKRESPPTKAQTVFFFFTLCGDVNSTQISVWQLIVQTWRRARRSPQRAKYIRVAALFQEPVKLFKYLSKQQGCSLKRGRMKGKSVQRTYWTHRTKQGVSFLTSFIKFRCSSFRTCTFFIAAVSVWAVSTCSDSSAQHVTGKNKMSTKLSNFQLFFFLRDETSIEPLLLRFAFRARLCPLVVKTITNIPFWRWWNGFP